MATVGSVVVHLVAKTKRFQDGMRKSTTHLKTFGREGAAVQKVMGQLAAAIGGFTAVGAGLIVFHKVSQALQQMGRDITAEIPLIDALTKKARQLGVSVKELQGLQYAAELTGPGGETLEAGLATMAKRLGEAVRAGQGPAAMALKDLKLSIKDLVALSPHQAFLEIAEALKKIEEPARRNAIAANLFSKANMSLVNTLSEGRGGLRAMAEEMERFGGALTETDTAKVEALVDQFTRLERQRRATTQRLAVATAPYSQMYAGLKLQQLNLLAQVPGILGAIAQAPKAILFGAEDVAQAQDAAEDVTLETLAAREAAEEYAAALEKATANAEKLAKTLRFDVETYGLGAVEKQIEKFVQAGVPAEIIEGLRQQNKELERRNELEREGKRLEREAADKAAKDLRYRQQVMDEMRADDERNRAMIRQLTGEFDPVVGHMQRLGNYERLFKAGLSQDIYQKAIAASERQAIGGIQTPGYRPVAAMREGSREAYSAIARARSGEQDAQKRLLQTALKALREEVDQRRVLEQIEQNTKQQFEIAEAPP